MKYVREHINEKFEEDTDVVNDMGIGLPEFREIHASLKELNTATTSHIDDSFNIAEYLKNVHTIEKFVFLTVKYHIKEKFNIDITVLETPKIHNMTDIIEIGGTRIGTTNLMFKINKRTNEMYFTVSEVKYRNRKFLMTSLKCKTLGKLDIEIQKAIEKFKLKIPKRKINTGL